MDGAATGGTCSINGATHRQRISGNWIGCAHDNGARAPPNTPWSVNAEADRHLLYTRLSSHECSNYEAQGLVYSGRHSTVLFAGKRGIRKSAAAASFQARLRRRFPAPDTRCCNSYLKRLSTVSRVGITSGTNIGKRMAEDNDPLGGGGGGRGRLSRFIKATVRKHEMTDAASAPNSRIFFFWRESPSAAGVRKGFPSAWRWRKRIQRYSFRRQLRSTFSHAHQLPPHLANRIEQPRTPGARRIQERHLKPGHPTISGGREQRDDHNDGATSFPPAARALRLHVGKFTGNGRHSRKVWFSVKDRQASLCD